MYEYMYGYTVYTLHCIYCVQYSIHLHIFYQRCTPCGKASMHRGKRTATGLLLTTGTKSRSRRSTGRLDAAGLPLPAVVRGRAKKSLLLVIDSDCQKLPGINRVPSQLDKILIIK